MLICLIAATTDKSLQSCLTLCEPIDSSPPGSPVPGIPQARTLKWVAISFSSAWKWKVKVKSLSHVRLLSTPWTAAHQAPPSMGFSRPEYWSRVPLPSPICLTTIIYFCPFFYVSPVFALWIFVFLLLLLSRGLMAYDVYFCELHLLSLKTLIFVSFKISKVNKNYKLNTQNIITY